MGLFQTVLLNLVEFSVGVSLITHEALVAVHKEHLGVQLGNDWALGVRVFYCALGLCETEPFLEEAAFVLGLGRGEELGEEFAFVQPEGGPGAEVAEVELLSAGEQSAK